MGENAPITQYLLFPFLKYFPIPEILRRSIYGFSIFDRGTDIAEPTNGRRSIKTLKRAPLKRRKIVPQETPKKLATAPATYTGRVTIGYKSQLAIGEEHFAITQDTWIFGEVRIGTLIQLTASRRHDGILKALKIVVM